MRKKKEGKRLLILERDQRLLRYKKQKNKDSNIKVTDSDLRSNQTKSPKKKKKWSKKNLSMAQQWNEEYCYQPCLARHGRENDEEYLVVNHVHDHKSTPPRHDKGDLVVLGDNAHEVGGARWRWRSVLQVQTLISVAGFVKGLGRITREKTTRRGREKRSGKAEKDER